MCVCAFYRYVLQNNYFIRYDFIYVNNGQYAQERASYYWPV